MDAVAGDLVVGALGKRSATLEVVGDWGHTGVDGAMHTLTGAGLFGFATSLSTWLAPLTPIVYRGHVTRDGCKLNMRDFVEHLAGDPHPDPSTPGRIGSRRGGNTMRWKHALALVSGVACGGPDDSGEGVVLEGGVEKGPFVLGSSVAVSSIDASANPLGDVFNTSTLDDLGRFRLTIDYEGPAALEATGFHYNEVTGALSTAPLPRAIRRSACRRSAPVGGTSARAGPTS